MEKLDFNCKICNSEGKTPKTDFCKTCNVLKNEILKFDKKLKLVTNDGYKELKKKRLFQKKYKAEYLLELRKGLNPKIKVSSMDLERLYNNLEIFLKRNPKINTTFHWANKFDSLPQKYKSFLFSSLSHVLFDSTKKLYPNNLWFLARSDYPWEN